MVSPLELATKYVTEYTSNVYNAVKIGGVELDYMDCAFLGVLLLGGGLFAYCYIKYILKDAIEEARRAKEGIALEEDKYLDSGCLEDELAPPRIF